MGCHRIDGSGQVHRREGRGSSVLLRSTIAGNSVRFHAQKHGRSTYVYDRSSSDVKRRIEQGIKDAAAEALVTGGDKIACPSLLISGSKADS